MLAINTPILFIIYYFNITIIIQFCQEKWVINGLKRKINFNIVKKPQII